MDTEEYQVSALIPASPNSIYTSWMDERRHSAFSGARATVDPWVGGRITALNGQVDATHVLLEAGRRITLAWRTRDFGPGVPDSRVDISLAPAAGGTEVTIHHTQIPAGSSEAFKKTWKSSYLDPMKKFFGKPSGMRAAMAAAKKGGYLPSSRDQESRPGYRRPIIATPRQKPEEAIEAAEEAARLKVEKKLALRRKAAEARRHEEDLRVREIEAAKETKRQAVNKRRAEARKKAAAVKAAEDRKRSAAKKKLDAAKKKIADARKRAAELLRAAVAKKKAAAEKKAAKKR